MSTATLRVRRFLQATVAALAITVPTCLPSRPPSTAAEQPRPNVVVIVLDDVGFADIGAFGSEIRTPNIDALARDGLRYNHFDTRAICSATRASLLTGRNNQTVGMASLAQTNPAIQKPSPEDTVNGASAKGANRGELSSNAETLAQALHTAGYATEALGKWHLAPSYDEAPGYNRGSWPLQRGFDHYYGFLGGMSDQYRPKLVSDNEHTPTPTQPGYHLSVDLTDHAIADWKAFRQQRPTQPRFLYLAYGTAHKPLQVPEAYIDSYNRVYDKGWDTLRAERFVREKVIGIIPANTQLPPRNAGDAAWSSLTTQQKRVFARFMQTYAGYLTHCDEQIGRLISYLKQSGQYDNTLFVLLSDNGAAPESGQKGVFYSPVYEEDVSLEEMDAHLGDLGSPKTQPGYQRPWAMAGVTPFRRYKQWPYLGGVRTPLIITWKNRIGAAGAIRPQPVDAIDLAPTILDAVGAQFHSEINGKRQIPVAGRSVVATWDSAVAPTRSIQFFQLDGNRAIRAGKWRAVAMNRGPGTSSAQDRWQLFDTQADFAESKDVAKRYPAVLHRLQKLWWQQARRYSDPQIMPLDQTYYHTFLHMDDALRD
jgi:arylsulfatase